jgi:hypothetical protein
MFEISPDQVAGGMTALTIEPPEGDRATLVGISVKDDPVSQDLIGTLQCTAPAAA